MDEHLTSLLGDLHHHGVGHDAAEPDYLDRFGNLTPATASWWPCSFARPRPGRTGAQQLKRLLDAAAHRCR